MVWEGVPWMVDGADHSAEVGRTLAYAATGGNEGVVSASDCKVVASNIPDGNVHVQSGAVVALNRFPGGGQQTYILRNVGDDVKALDPQGSGGARYDLVAIIIEDPQYSGQPEPVSEDDGPYARTVIYKNVGSTAETLAEVDPDQTGLVLARVRFNASDGTITNEEITDLRHLAMPKTTRKVIPAETTQSINLTSAGYTEWPPTDVTVQIPTWATGAVITASLSSLAHFAPEVGGYLRLKLGDATDAPFGYGLDNVAGAERTSMTISGDFEITPELQGTTQPLIIEGYRAFGAGYISTHDAPIILFDITFVEEAV